MIRLHNWTDAASYAKPDLYASLAAVTLPDSGYPLPVTEPKTGTFWAIAFGTVATREPSRQSTLPSRPFGRVSTIALGALTWAVIVGCYLLLASGAL